VDSHTVLSPKSRTGPTMASPGTAAWIGHRVLPSAAAMSSMPVAGWPAVAERGVGARERDLGRIAGRHERHRKADGAGQGAVTVLGKYHAGVDSGGQVDRGTDAAANTQLPPPGVGHGAHGVDSVDPVERRGVGGAMLAGAAPARVRRCQPGGRRRPGRARGRIRWWSPRCHGRTAGPQSRCRTPGRSCWLRYPGRRSSRRAGTASS
jgi:hypothetical protein